MRFERLKESLVIHHFIYENKTENEIAEILQISKKRVVQLLTKNKVYDKYTND